MTTRYINKTEDNEYDIHCTREEVESIYQGLIMIANIERDMDQRKMIAHQVRAIEDEIKDLRY